MHKRKESEKMEEIMKLENEYLGIEPESSLQSVNFAVTENHYFNERYQDETLDV